MNETELKAHTKKFAHACFKLTMDFPGSKLGKHIVSLFIRCATSVAAKYRATCYPNHLKVLCLN
jgi:hypothetical protein